ncbi:hypothetical protein JMJ77_0007834 [Colletotrichum scovillei]|uniref:Uncharacterized protein n=1 Tax=Colletotrichum scovillei TaxID=1209932 RepID=A0A9P7UGB0_9PEZI|nr:hypothetical protein JMJ77_0007834 [Colletotrichum scovillei]KAG7074844.1 hypothetical protein JMJ76_0011312 [Colletotrichum scovillei]KAG7081968.1 hypothetical protein JMJ78_0004077 [Colletotrichum scovillei]
MQALQDRRAGRPDQFRLSCTCSVYYLNPRMIRLPTAQLSQSTVPRSLVTSLVSNLRLGESDAPSPYCLGLIDPGDSSPVNATQETLFLLFAPFCIRIRETSTYPDRPDCLWRMPGQMSLTADSKTGQQQHPSKKPGPCPVRRSAFSLRYAGD